MIELACILAAAVGSWDDFAVILVMLLANAALGFREEFKATAAIRELAAGLKPTVSVKRDGQFRQIDVDLLVPGDLIFVRGGNKCPADCHFIKGDEISLDNSALTGETRLLKRPLKGCKIANITQDADGHSDFTVEQPDGNEQPGLFRDQIRPSADGNGRCAVGDSVEQIDLLAGGTIKQGEAYVMVDRTGLNTEIGKASGKVKGPGKGAGPVGCYQ